MKIERLDENRIKITVGSDDVRMWNVDLKNFTDNTPEAQDMLGFALRQAEQDFNFTVGKAQLLVETMKISDDGFVMVVSRLENESELLEALIKAGKLIRRTEVKTRRKTRAISTLRIFKFVDFEDVCRGVKEIRELYLGTSRLWKYDGEFYLELVSVDTFGLFEIENILSEFSQKSKQPAFMQGILNEHAKIMIDSDAVSIISEKFV